MHIVRVSSHSIVIAQLTRSHVHQERRQASNALKTHSHTHTQQIDSTSRTTKRSILATWREVDVMAGNCRCSAIVGASVRCRRTAEQTVDVVANTATGTQIHLANQLGSFVSILY